MSAYRSTTIICDEPHCGQWVMSDDLNDDARSARKAGRRRGWKRVGGKDICPAHRTVDTKDGE